MMGSGDTAWGVSAVERSCVASLCFCCAVCCVAKWWWRERRGKAIRKHGCEWRGEQHMEEVMVEEWEGEEEGEEVEVQYYGFPSGMEQKNRVGVYDMKLFFVQHSTGFFILFQNIKTRLLKNIKTTLLTKMAPLFVS